MVMTVSDLEQDFRKFSRLEKTVAWLTLAMFVVSAAPCLPKLDHYYSPMHNGTGMIRLYSSDGYLSFYFGRDAELIWTPRGK